MQIHGQSSGYYAIRHSSRFREYFWNFPTPGTSARTQAPYHGKSEEQLMQLTQAKLLMPEFKVAENLLKLYWTYVHPHLPMLHRSLVERQFRMLWVGHKPDGKPGRTHANQALPYALLYAMFAVASRYAEDVPSCDSFSYWPAGDEYAQKAKDILEADFPTSRISSVQAWTLLAYRDIGCGAMVSSWNRVGTAVRIAQDIGLYKDVDKWGLPISRFTWEDKQTRYGQSDDMFTSEVADLIR